MGNELLERAFSRIGARVKITEPDRRWRWTTQEAVNEHLSLDIRQDSDGSYFELQAGPNREVTAVDIKPKLRHALVLARHRETGEKDKFLCGHDERDWFVAAVPNAAGVSNVRSAMEALKPGEVRTAQDQARVKQRHRTRRKTRGYVRQGEWFFIRVPDLDVAGGVVHRNEPLQRSGGKPHWADELYRTNGEIVYVSPQHPEGLSEEEYRELMRRRPAARFWEWDIRAVAAGVYVRGRVRHPDHRTIRLDGWHLVLMNTEHESRAMRNVRFID